MIFTHEIEILPEKYILTVEQKKNDTILITCNLKDDTVTLFDYYKELSFEDLI